MVSPHAPASKVTALVHVCCAPDAAHGIFALGERFEVTGFFYNPNIHPEEERNRRIAAAEELRAAMPFPLETAAGDEAAWDDSVRGLEGEPERGRRCEACVRMRLRETARRARDGGYAAFGTVLTVSPKKDAAMVNRVGREEGEAAGIPFIAADLKKKDGFRKSVEISKRLGIYRQDYCGCRYSVRKNGGSVRESNPPETLLPPDRI